MNTMDIVLFVGSLICLKALIIGSDFNFHHLFKYGKVYWNWYNNRPKFQPPEPTVAAPKKQSTIDLSKSQMMCGNCLAFEDEGHKPWCNDHTFKKHPPLISQKRSIIQ